MKSPTHRNGVRLLQPTTKGFREWLRGPNRWHDSVDLVAGHAASRVLNNPSWPRTESLRELREYARGAYGGYTVAQITSAWREWRRARELAEAQARGDGEVAELPTMRLINGPIAVCWFADEEPSPTMEELSA